MMRFLVKKRVVFGGIAILFLAVLSFLFWQLLAPKKDATLQQDTPFVYGVDSLLKMDYSGTGREFLTSDELGLTAEDLAYMYIKKMSSLISKNQTDSIGFYANKALTCTSGIQNEDLRTKLHYNLGKYYSLIGDYATSLSYTLKGLSFVHSDTESRIDLYNSLGAIYFEINEFDSAIVYFTKSLEVATKLKDQKRIAVANGNLGGAYLIQQDYPKANRFLSVASVYFEKEKDTLNVIRLYTTRSKLALKEKKFTEANSYLAKAEQLSVNSKKNVLIGLVYQHYGNYYFIQKKYKLAEEYYEKAYVVSNAKKIPRDQLNALNGLRDVSVAVGHFKEAFARQDLYYQLRDSIYGAETRQKMEEIKWSDEVEEQRIKNKLLQGEYELEKQNKMILTILYLIIIISIIVFATLLYINNKKSLRISKLTNDKLQEKFVIEQKMKKLQEQQFQQELEQKNQELIALNILVLAKNKIFNEIEDIVDKENQEEVVSELKRKVKSNKNQEKDWDKFKEIFEKMHPSFYQTIDEKYPQLSKTEIRICSYIKIAMSKNEIGAMMNISHSSLITSRYRIRKKLNLENKDDLDEFIRSW